MVNPKKIFKYSFLTTKLEIYSLLKNRLKISTSKTFTSEHGFAFINSFLKMRQK